MTDTPTEPTPNNDKPTITSRVMNLKGVRPIVCLILFAVGVIMFTAQTHVGHITGGTWLSNHAMELVDDGMQSNQRTFLIFSAIKGTLAVIEGSTIGVGIQAEVGDLIQPVYDYVDYFWNIFLVSFIVMGFYKVLLETDLFLLGYPIMGFGLMTLAVSGMLQGRRWNAAAFARKLILIGLLVIYALPLSLVASRGISDAYVSKLKTQKLQHIVAFQNRLNSAKYEFLELKEEVTMLAPGDSLDKVRTGVQRLVNNVKQTFETALQSFMYYVLIIVFEVMILPFCTAFIIYLITRRLLDGFVLPKIPALGVLPRARPG